VNNFEDFSFILPVLAFSVSINQEELKTVKYRILYQ